MDRLYLHRRCHRQPSSEALLISPPEDHDNRYGYVLCVSGAIFRLPATEDGMMQIIRASSHGRAFETGQRWYPGVGLEK